MNVHISMYILMSEVERQVVCIRDFSFNSKCENQIFNRNNIYFYLYYYNITLYYNIYRV